VTERATIVHNEQVKLRAAALNTMATSCFAIGVLAPIATSFYNLTSDHVPVHTVVLGIVLWMAAAVGLHRQAIRMLEGLKE
jgi:predicted tellurium resistance membrane protein TerC